MFVGLVTGANILGLNTMGDRFGRRVFRFGRQRLEMVAEDVMCRVKAVSARCGPEGQLYTPDKAKS